MSAATSESAKVIRACLDTCIVRGLAQTDSALLPAERKPALKLLQLHDKGSVHLITSAVALQELERTSSEEGGTQHVAICLLLRNIRTFPISSLTTRGPFGQKTNPRYLTRSQIKVALPDLTDVELVYQTWVHHLSYFVTIDQATILDLRDQLAVHTGIRAVKPSELLGIVRAST
jgi:hypothetical protein